jgi:retron-type reverse transcriptase
MVPLAEPKFRLEDFLFEDENPNSIFERLFSADALCACYADHFTLSRAKGIDRFNGASFKKIATESLEASSKKCISGKFKFSPYLQHLRSKGAGKKPREISIATVRDRVVLFQMKELLYSLFGNLRGNDLANTKVHKLGKLLSGLDRSKIEVLRTDIEDFFPSVRHDVVLERIKEVSKSTRITSLFRKALENQDYPTGRRANRLPKRAQGVPQGLSISSAMANLHLSEIDEKLNKKFGARYFRYVDDILIVCNQGEGKNVFTYLKRMFSKNGLRLHKLGNEKSDVFQLSSGFIYLGYKFSGVDNLGLTVRQSSIDNLMENLVGLFTDFIRNKKKDFSRKPKFRNDQLYKSVFIEKLNERITGAFSENRRFGWMFFFSEITDLQLLHKVDFVVATQFSRLPEFGGTPPPTIKTFMRTYFEVRHSKDRSYFVDYDSVSVRR